MPEPVRRFIARHIHTLEQLEILLLLIDSSRAWSDQEIASTLRTTRESVRSRLSRLLGDGLVGASAGPSPTYRYQPRSEALDQDVQSLARCYRERRVAVISQIFAPDAERAALFADAFRIKKEDG